MSEREVPPASQSERACCGCIVGFVGVFMLFLILGALVGLVR